MIAATMFVQSPPTFEAITTCLDELEAMINDHRLIAPVTI